VPLFDLKFLNKLPLPLQELQIGGTSPGDAAMNEDALNASLRKFLKTVGVTAQREIEKSVRQAVAEGRIKGNETLPAKALITLAGTGLSLEIDGALELE
jgi:hypothetical protein